MSVLLRGVQTTYLFFEEDIFVFHGIHVVLHATHFCLLLHTALLGRFAILQESKTLKVSWVLKENNSRVVIAG